MKPSDITWSQWLLYNYYFMAGNILGQRITENYFKPKKQRLFQQIAQNENMAQRGEQIPTEEIEQTDPELFLKDPGKLTNQLLIFRGQAKNWPCMEKWTQEFFVEKLGNYQADIIDNEGLADEGTEFTETDMATFVKTMKDDKKNYLRFSRIIDDNPELKKDLDLNFINSFKHGATRGDLFYFFMGEAGTKTEMHHAMPATLFIQIKGKKKWTIYAPEERIMLDPVAKRTLYHFSKANPYELDNPDFPLLKSAKYYQFELDEGDIMWMPPFYWHYVENPTASIGLAFKFVDLAMAFKLSKVCLFHYFTATNPNIISSFFHNKKHKHDLLYEQKKKKNKKHLV